MNNICSFLGYILLSENALLFREIELAEGRLIGGNWE